MTDETATPTYATDSGAYGRTLEERVAGLETMVGGILQAINDVAAIVQRTPGPGEAIEALRDRVPAFAALLIEAAG